MRALITGIEGFAGSHLADHLLAQGDEVWGTCRIGARATNIKHLLDSVTLRIGDLSKQSFINAILSEIEFDAIYHLAAISFMPEAEKMPSRTYEVNLLGGLHVLEAVRTHGHNTSVVLASSAEVYGHVQPEEMPVRETHAYRPVNIFAASKAALEIMVQPFVSGYGLRVVIARPFNHTGPRQRADFVCSTFAQQVAMVEAKMTPHIAVGDLSPRRDFSDVRDIVRGYRLLALHGKAGEAYNLASSRSYAIQELLDMLMNMARVKVDVYADPDRLRQTQVMDVRGSYEKIHCDCHWEPEIPLEKTMRDLLNWHRDLIAKRTT